MSLVSISKPPFLAISSYPATSKKSSNFPLVHLGFFSPGGKGPSPFSPQREIVLLPIPSSVTNKRSDFGSLIHWLKHPQKDSVSFEEIENCLEALSNEDFEKNASPEEMSIALHLIIDYARQGTKAPLEQKILEEDIQNLFKEEKIQSYPKAPGGCYLDRVQGNLCFEKQSTFKGGIKKLGKFIKKHKKAIIITVCVVAAVGVATLVTVAIVKSVGATAIAEGAVAAGAAAAGAAGAVPPSEHPKGDKAEETNKPQSSSRAEWTNESLENKNDLDKVTHHPFNQTVPETISLSEDVSNSQKESAIDFSASVFPPTVQFDPDVFSNCTQKEKEEPFLMSSESHLVPKNGINDLYTKNQISEEIEDIFSEQAHLKGNKLIQTTDYHNNPSLPSYKDTFVQKLKNVGAKLSHDLYHGWATFEGDSVLEAQKIRNFMVKFLPKNMLDSLNADTYEKQQEVVAEIHSKIDQFFTTNQGVNYLPENKNQSDCLLGILPAPWDILGALRIPTTWANKVKGWKLGQSINNLTAKGEIPRWDAVRQRHWKNKAFLHERGHIHNPQRYEPTPENIARMKKGLAPQLFNEKRQCLESIELHHIPPQREGGLFNFIELTPLDHAAEDPFRKIGKS